MVALSFKAQFAPPIVAGIKRQTVRAGRKRPPRAGERLQLYTGMRTKHCRKIIPDPICTEVSLIVIEVDAELRSQQEAERKGLLQRNAGPLEQYRTQLEANKEDSGRRVEALIVQELDYVHRSITDTISSRLGVEDPLLKGLIDMFIENILIRPLANALAGASGSGGGFFSALFGGLGGDGGGSILSAGVRSVGFGGGPNADGTLSFAGLFAGGGLIPDGAWGIVGDAGPEPIRATAGGIEVLPNSSLRALGGSVGGRPGTLKVEISGARGNREIQEMVREGVAQVAQAGGNGVAIQATWDAAGRAGLRYEVRYRPTAGGNWVLMTVESEDRTGWSGPVSIGTEYEVQVRALTIGRFASAWSASVTITPSATLSAPSALTATGSAGSASVSFRNPPEASLAYARVYRATSTSFGSAVQIGSDIVGGLSQIMSVNDTGLAAGTYYYWARAFNGSGGASALAGPVSAAVT